MQKLGDHPTVPQMGNVEYIGRHESGWHLTPDKLYLEIDEDTPYQAWIELGRNLAKVDKRIWWYVGDWWAFGERKYGDRKEAAEAAGLNYQSCKDAAWVSRQFERSRRRDLLGWSVHREVAALPPVEQDRILDEAATVKDARLAARTWKAAREKANPAPLPADRYRVIYADPPWRYNDQHVADGFDAIVPDSHYPTMPTADICAMPVRDMAMADAVLFLWGTFPMLEDALAVVQAWGFQYKTAMVWDKQRPNLGHYHSACAELLLIGTRGACAPWVDSRPAQIISEKAPGKHSSKPETFRGIIDALYPYRADGEVDRIELFRRGDAPANWRIWGNEAAE